MAQDRIGDSADGTAGIQVTKDAAVEVCLLEVEVELLALVARGRVEVGEYFSLQTTCECVVELNL